MEFDRKSFILDIFDHPEFYKLKEYKFAQNLYAALCNNDWSYKGEQFSVSWRAAGRLVADIRNELFSQAPEDYISFYCSGLSCDYDDRPEERGFLAEGIVSDEIKHFLEKIDCILMKGTE